MYRHYPLFKMTMYRYIETNICRRYIYKYSYLTIQTLNLVLVRDKKKKKLGLFPYLSLVRPAIVNMAMQRDFKINI